MSRPPFPDRPFPAIVRPRRRQAERALAEGVFLTAHALAPKPENRQLAGAPPVRAVRASVTKPQEA